MIMGCDETREQLMDLLYDEGTPEARAESRAHLDACASCRAEWEALRGTRARVAALADRDVPSAATARILRAAAERRRQGFAERLADWLGPLALHPTWATAAIALVVVVSSFAIYQSTRPPSVVATRGVGPIMHEEIAPSPEHAPASAKAGEPLPATAAAPTPADEATASATHPRSRRESDDRGAPGDEAEAGSNRFAMPPREWHEAPVAQARDEALAPATPAAAPAPRRAARSLADADGIASNDGALGTSEAKASASSSALGGASGSGATATAAAENRADPSSLHANADRLRARGRCADAVALYERVLAAPGYSRAQEAAAGEAECLRLLGRCAALDVLARRVATAPVEAERARCETPAKAKAAQPR